MHVAGIALGLAFYSTISLAQQNQLILKSNDAYLTEQSKIINSTNFQANQIIK